ncbi:hypothetical protein PsorP6_016957 [Peronosclerospora sorghi]|uniref:Uncharacterized protein n=1 Tax=Peronosclerospora sorghi TaxID=230839 RepID=A0ACC0WDG7_9STRA|nr:hypothetical protein PsorP6_016957 [Peronosclerospora sorghi]
MHPRGRRQRHEAEYARHKTLFLSLAEESKSALSELSSALLQRYRNRAPDHETQQVLRRKNEVINRLKWFIAELQRTQEVEEERIELDTMANQRSTIARLEKQLRDQRAAFDRERTQLQQQARSSLNAQVELDVSLKRIMPQLRELVDAYDKEQEEQGGLAEAGRPTVEELTQRLNEQQTTFEAERMELLEQLNADYVEWDITQQQQIMSERELMLTCPISLDLFEDPVLTTCCGKTFSSEPLDQALRRNYQCPFCRSDDVDTHANLDMANLVELHRTERSLQDSVDARPQTVTTQRSVRQGRQSGADRGSAVTTAAVPNRSQQPRPSRRYERAPPVAEVDNIRLHASAVYYDSDSDY